MLLQGLHASFLGFQMLVAWEFLIKGIELSPEIAQRFQLTDTNRQIYPYLTVWNLVLHILYIVACAAEDVLVAVTERNVLTNFKEEFSKNRAFVFETFVFPGSMLVVTAYSILTLMDPLYLFPGPIEDLIPSWINFLIHYGVGMFAVLEVILRSEAWSPHHRLRRLRTGCAVLILYKIAICTHRYMSGAWIYPFVHLIPWTLFFALFPIIISIAVLYYHLGNFLSTLIHGSRSIRTKQTQGIINKHEEEMSKQF